MLATHWQDKVCKHRLVLLHRVLLQELVGVNRVACLAGAWDVGRDVVEDAVVVRLWEAASPLIWLCRTGCCTAYQIGPETSDAPRSRVPITHCHHAPVYRRAADLPDDIFALGDGSVRRMDRNEAQTWAVLHWRWWQDACHCESARVAIMAQAATAMLLHLPFW